MNEVTEPKGKFKIFSKLLNRANDDASLPGGTISN